MCKKKLKYVKYYLKTENGILKIQTKHSFSLPKLITPSQYIPRKKYVYINIYIEGTFGIQ